MMRRLLLSLATCLPVLYASAQDGLWSPVPKSSFQPSHNGRLAAAPLPTSFELVKLNRSQLQVLQQQAPLVKPGQRSSLSPVHISLPLPVASQFLSSAFTESPVITDALAGQLTGFKTYELKDPATHALQGRLTITPQGISGLIFTDKGSAYISPVGPDYPDVHMVYYVKDIPVTTPVLCGAKDLVNGKNGAGNRVSTVLGGDCNLRNFKLAVAATGEYTAWAGSQTQALIYIGTLVNDVTAIYERDAAITFTLVSNNSIIFTDATTDPYPTVGFPNTTTLNTNHNTLTSILGSGNFDQGIVLNNGWQGGLAYLGVVCDPTYKGGAAAGITFGYGSNPSPGPQGPVFTGTVAHEMAHQFSATHTMASGNSNCGSGNTNVPTGYEPGGGSTIMAYAGSCGTPDAYQNNSDLYFHGASILQIDNYAVNFATCETPVALSNSAPTVSVAATTYTIPVSTPFMLTATGADANNPTLYYCWEQMDAPTAPTFGTPSATDVNGPLFRSYPPTTSNTRYFPRMADLVSGAATPFEVLPSVSRALNFQVMVRDEAAGGGCTAQTTVTVNTNTAAGPFAVTSQSTATTWTPANTVAITWNVAGSNAAPVNCSNVDILFSRDGGVTFTDTLIANTANDGTENITVPNLLTEVGRVMVKARGNIFFNINTAFIKIASSCTANGSTFTPGTAVTGAAGSSSLHLSLSPVYGSQVAISGTLSSTDPIAGLSVMNTSTNSCDYYGGNIFQYDTYRFTPSVSGNYSFTPGTTTNPYITFNLYSGDFNPGNPCSDIMNSSAQDDGTTLYVGNPYTVSLYAGLYYTMAVGTFGSGAPTLPSDYTINVSNAGGGKLYSNTPSPGAGINYTYVIVDNATGLIKAIDASSDLSNASNYPIGGNYTVYGLSTSASTTTLNSYAGTSFASFKNTLLYNPAALCGSLSANNVQVTITATLASAQMQPLSAFKNGNTVTLKWMATSSQHISYFEIWRSADGNNFNEFIGTVPAQNNGSSSVDYELNDNAPHATWNYYRVKQVNTDGTPSLGNIASINMQLQNTTLAVYPNPVKTTSLTLAYTSTGIETVGVRVLNSTGSLVYQTVFPAQSGANKYSIPAGPLAKGVYVVQLVSSSGSYTTRFVKE
jgi:hypothetical protein